MKVATTSISRRSTSPRLTGKLRFLDAVLLTTLLALFTPASAQLRESEIARSIVSVNVYDGERVVRRVTGVLVQSDRFNGYVVSNANTLVGGNSYTVTVPRTGNELVAQVMRTERAVDFVLLKVNGLSAPPLSFAESAPMPGSVVWSASKRLGDSTSIGLGRGVLGNNYGLGSNGFSLYAHSALAPAGGTGSVLLNECGELAGFNLSTSTADGSMRAIDTNTLRSLLVAQNINLTLANGPCMSEVAIAQQEARRASEDARRAQSEAEKAQVVAANLERRLADSTERNAQLEAQTVEARRRADDALRAARSAQEEAERNRATLQERTENLRREAEMLKDRYEQDQAYTRTRFESAMRKQEEAARQREYVLIGLVMVLFVGILLLLILRPRDDTRPSPSAKGRKAQSIKPPTVSRHEEVKPATTPQEAASREYVLDGRDDGGIRYLLRISGEQLARDEGVVIGRNPGESLYIINHADVSRQHARMKMTKNRLFVEDLGSTNGTSVNGQNIDEKGPVVIQNGDQVVIGSVIMDLKVLAG